MKLQLTRNLQTEDVTLGYMGDRLTDFVLYTLENPWKNNRPYISCIPPGEYVCERRVSPRFGETFEVKNVNGRTHILFHAGNYEDDTSGCILLGKEVQPPRRMIIKSRQAMDEFMEYLRGLDTFDLEILDGGKPAPMGD